MEELFEGLGDASESEKARIGKEYLERAVAERKVSRYTLMGDAIGFVVDGKLVLQAPNNRVLC